MNQLLSISPLFGLVIGCAIPILIIVKCEQAYRLVNQNRKIYIFKASVALAVWGGLSLLLLIFLSGYMMGLAHTPNPGTTSDLSLIFTFCVMELIYGGVGWLLVLWMKRREEV
ncbi:MAG: hypothetical protein QOH42_1300 [Blastocatellia bacterium]|jgi:hypothetical protein|nr:hypothetical protein [Blastocatellia bacterium]